MRSTLMCAKAGQQTRRGYCARRERKRFGQVIDAPGRDRNVARSAKFFERACSPNRFEERYGSTTVRHLKRFAALDETQHLTRPLAQLPNPDRSHVLLVAHLGEWRTAVSVMAVLPRPWPTRARGRFRACRDQVR